MKKLLLLAAFGLLVFACSKKEKKFELFSPEAFAYSMEDGWELNISCQAKGYELFEHKGKYYSKLSFVVDIKNPDGSIKQKAQSGKIEQLANEEDADTQLNSQIKLDSNYKPGKYVVIINMKDEQTGKQMKIEKEFELTE